MYKRELQQTARKSLFLKLFHLPYGILIPILISTEVTNALAGKTKSVLTTAAGILAIVFCYTYFYGRLEIAFRKEKEQVVQACKMKQYRTIFSNSYEKLYHSGLGENLENMKDDFNAVAELMTEHRPMFAASLAEAVLFGGYLCWKSTLIGICLILISLLQVIPPLLVKKYIQVNYDNCREIEGKITDYTVSAFQGFMTIKLYQLKDWWLSHLEELFQAYIKIGSNSIFANRSEAGMYAVLDHVLKYGTYCLIGVFVLFGKANLETGIQAIALSGNIYAAVKSAFEIYPRFVESSRAQKRLEEWENDRDAAAEAGTLNAALPIRMEIEWRRVSFSYDKPVLKNVTARMDLTQNHIIRGENGAGKSTLIKLLLGMETPQSGEISVLGSATGQLDKMLFPSEIFYLPQKAPVFDLTAGQMLSAVIETEDGTAAPDDTPVRGESPSVRSRVTDSERTAIHGESPSARGNEPRCTNALAREHRFAQRLSQLGEDFNEFCKKPLAEMSEGQRKKFYLALAFSGDAKLLILDEPTNHLDDAGRKTLAEWITQRGRGVVVISHDSVFETVDAVCWKLQNGGLAYV